MFRECLSNTTAHGVPQLVDNKNNGISKLIWTLILLASCAVFIYHSSSLIEKYVNHETAVSMKIDGIHFIIPDIYICNMNPFSRARVDQHLKTKNEEFFNMSLAIQNELKNNLNYSLSIYLNRQVKRYSKEFLLNLVSNRNFSDFALFHKSFLYNQYKVKPSDVFDQVYNVYHSYCYKLKDSFKKYIHQKSALEFTMYTDEFNFIDWPYTALFAKIQDENKNEYSHTIYFVNPGEYPHEQATNVGIKTGRKTTIEVTSDYYDRLDTTEHGCNMKREDVTYILDWSNASNSTKLTYTGNAHDCALKKYHERFMQICNCSWSMYSLSFNLWKSQKMNLCWKTDFNRWTNLDDRKCYNPISQSIDDFYPNCINKNPCKMSEYFTRTVQRKSILQRISEAMTEYKNMKIQNVTEVPPHLKTNSFVEISIYAPKRLSRVYKEYKAYELKDLLSDIGGILGFYVGISVVTILEIFGYLGRKVNSSKDSTDQIEAA